MVKVIMRLEVRKKDGMQGQVMMKGGQEGDVSRPGKGCDKG